MQAHPDVDLKRVARYLIGHGRVIQKFGRQAEERSHFVVFTDSVSSDCLRTREGTASSKLFVAPTGCVQPAPRKR